MPLILSFGLGGAAGGGSRLAGKHQRHNQSYETNPVNHDQLRSLLPQCPGTEVRKPGLDPADGLEQLE